MNIRLLKKLRKRYKYYWDKASGERCTLLVLDTKKQESHRFGSASGFVHWYTFTHLGLRKGFAYDERLDRREKRNKYLQHLKQLSHQSPQSNSTTTL